MLENVKIYISEDEDSEAYERYMSEKDCRGDVLVEYEEKLYKIEFITVYSLALEYDWEKSIDRVCLIWFPTIIVDNCRKDTIIKSILKLAPYHFKYFHPIKLDSDLYPPKYQNLYNWKQAYPT